MSVKRLLSIAVAGFVILAMTAWYYSHSLLRPEASIRASLLSQTPLGTDKAKVRTLAGKQGWLDPSTQKQSFVLVNLSTRTSVTTIRGRLGHYFFPHRRTVSVIWEFDARNRLVNILVIKTKGN